MWIPFKSSSYGRKESKLLSWVERYQGQTQGPEWKWEVVEGGGRRGTEEPSRACIQDRNTDEPLGGMCGV